ncbi:hypothetical protein COB21_00890 [Candidatus Aerophobetes bacterium]|uniref:Intracellular proteinase inhibitor BsuPI domain-containing protein n=1 Tax=Aerophobetes bacterium TaxID=2030807 RepID=A0A2A4X776_UNCAE|nr:MAG: hypothetical protein COB21_00890 [Candidatus Aerophobetes bacterium]
MKKLFLHFFTYLLFPLSTLFAGEVKEETLVEVTTSTPNIKPITPLRKQVFTDFLKLRITHLKTDKGHVVAKLSLEHLDKVKEFCFEHEKQLDSVHFYLVDKQGEKVWKSGALIRLDRQEDLSFYKSFDLVINPKKNGRLIPSGKYECSFQLKLNEEP